MVFGILLHAMLVPFPIGYFAGALMTDIVVDRSNRPVTYAN